MDSKPSKAMDSKPSKAVRTPLSVITEVVTKTIASVEKRRLSPAEETELARLRDAPFNAYRWSRATGSTRTGHPRAGAAHYGVVDARHLLYVAPVVRSARDAPDAPDPVFFLNTDMWDL